MNIAGGAISALFRSFFTGADPLRAAFGGAVGGAIVDIGMEWVGHSEGVQRFGAHQTVALGTNIVRNSGSGDHILSNLVFPFYPLYLRIKPVGGPSVGLSVSAMGTLGALYGLAAYGGTVDWRESLNAGSLVLSNSGVTLSCSTYVYTSGGAFCSKGLLGLHLFGPVVYATGSGPDRADRVLAHEFMHTAQHTRDALLNAVPASDKFFESIGAEDIGRWVVLDVALPFKAGAFLHGLSAGGVSLYEMEADLLIDARPCDFDGPYCD